MEANIYKKLTSDVRKLLYLPSLNDEQRKIITTYIDEYLVIWESYLVDKSLDNTLALQLLSGPVNEIYNLANPMFYEKKEYPAVELIKSHIDKYGKKVEESFNSIEKTSSFTKVLSNQNANKGHSLTEDVITSKAAFWQAPIILTISAAIGIILYFILL